MFLGLSPHHLESSCGQQLRVSPFLSQHGARARAGHLQLLGWNVVFWACVHVCVRACLGLGREF